MVSMRRCIVSTLWKIRQTKWLSLLLLLALTYALVFLLQVSIRLLKTPLRKLPQEILDTASVSLNDEQSKGVNQRNYKLTWLGGGQRDPYFTRNGLREERKGESNNENTHRDKLAGNNIQHGDNQIPNKVLRRKPKRKYIFVFRYYEQLGRATNNLLELASWAKYRNRLVVAPFVNNSRMSGLPGGVSHYLRVINPQRFGPLSDYFNMNYLNSLLSRKGYGTLADFDEFQSDCKKRLNIVVHFLFSNEDAMLDAAEWYRKSYKEMKEIYAQARANRTGWLPCPFIRHSRLQKQLDFKVTKYVCVDPEIIQDPDELERKVLQGRNCVGVVLWKGNGRNRVHFPLHPAISKPLTPPDVRFNPALRRIADQFVRKKLGGNFIAIHIRSERHLVRKGLNITFRCLRKLISRVQEAQEQFSIKRIFLATDLPEHGSDTFSKDQERRDRKTLLKFVTTELKQPVSYKPVDVYDNGAIAIIEMNILAAGKRLYTLGGGNFQNWIVNLFLKRHKNRSKKVHRMCEMS